MCVLYQQRKTSTLARSLETWMNEWMKQKLAKRKRKKKFRPSWGWGGRERETSKVFDVIDSFKHKTLLAFLWGELSIEFKWVYARLTFLLTICLPYKVINWRATSKKLFPRWFLTLKSFVTSTTCSLLCCMVFWAFAIKTYGADNVKKSERFSSMNEQTKPP